MRHARDRNGIGMVFGLGAVFGLAGATARADQFELLTGVNAGQAPGMLRPVAPSTPPPPGAPPNGFFTDGDRLAGTTGTVGDPWQGSGTPFYTPNQFGSLSYMFRRGSFSLFPGAQLPILGIDYLGGPRLDLDGDSGNGVRSLTPVAGQSPVAIGGSRSYLDLTVNAGSGSVSLNAMDVTSTNSGSRNLPAGFGVSTVSLAGTQPNGSSGLRINSGIDTRQGNLTSFSPGVWQVDSLGYELWADAIDGSSSTASTLGTLQYLGSMRGWIIERDGNGNFPTLAGQGLGGTRWPYVDASQVGNTFNTANNGGSATFTVSAGPALDQFDASGNGGLALTDFGGDLGAYLDSVVVPLIDPFSQRFLYLEGAGFGNNNSVDPIFGPTIGYDVVMVAQSTPVPEPTTLVLLASGFLLMGRRRRVVTVETE